MMAVSIMTPSCARDDICIIHLIKYSLIWEARLSFFENMFLLNYNFMVGIAQNAMA